MSCGFQFEFHYAKLFPQFLHSEYSFYLHIPKHNSLYKKKDDYR